MQSQALVAKKVTPPPPKGRPEKTGTLIGVRLQDDLLDAVDRQRRKEADLPNRPEMIRRLLERATAKGK